MSMHNLTVTSSRQTRKAVLGKLMQKTNLQYHRFPVSVVDSAPRDKEDF